MRKNCCYGIALLAKRIWLMLFFLSWHSALPTAPPARITDDANFYKLEEYCVFMWKSCTKRNLAVKNSKNKMEARTKWKVRWEKKINKKQPKLMDNHCAFNNKTGERQVFTNIVKKLLRNLFCESLQESIPVWEQTWRRFWSQTLSVSAFFTHPLAWVGFFQATAGFQELNFFQKVIKMVLRCTLSVIFSPFRIQTVTQSHPCIGSVQATQ